MTDLLTNQSDSRLGVLIRVSKLLSTLDLDKVLNQVVQLTTEVLTASKGAFFLLEERAGGLTLQRFLSERNYDPDEKQLVSMRVLQEGLAGWVLEHKEAAIVEDTLTDPRWLTLDAKTQGARSALCIPFFFEDEVYGILTLEHPDPGHFLESDKELARSIASQASNAMRNAQLFDRTQAQQKQMLAVLNSTTEALFTVDLEGKLGLVNKSAEEVLSLRGDRATGMPLDMLASESQLLAEIIDTIRDANVTGGTHTFEIADPNNSRDFVVSVSVVNQEQNQPVGSVVSIHDVSSLKDLSRLKTHLLQMASHDLKNPLGVLLGYLDMIREDATKGIVPDPAFVDGMFRAVERMEKLIQTLLSQERIEQEGSHPRQRIDPLVLLDSVMQEMRESANQKGHEIVLELGSQLSVISGDPVELREAMSNLISNAIKYTPDGGKITVKMTIDDDHLYFSVIDNGLGIPADQQQSVFNKYFRAKTESTANIEGTGLGLSLVKTVVEQHGGKVWFQSEEGAGSTFGFWLPVLTQ